jgi:hypothetical protein
LPSKCSLAGRRHQDKPWCDHHPDSMGVMQWSMHGRTWASSVEVLFDVVLSRRPKASKDERLASKDARSSANDERRDRVLAESTPADRTLSTLARTWRSALCLTLPCPTPAPPEYICSSHLADRSRKWGFNRFCWTSVNGRLRTEPDQDVHHRLT